MKIYFRTLHFWIRMISLACILTPMILIRLTAGRPPVPEVLVFSLLSASTVLIMLPIADENVIFSLVFALLELADSTCFALLPLPVMAVVVVAVVFIVYQFITADLQAFIYFQF